MSWFCLDSVGTEDKQNGEGKHTWSDGRSYEGQYVSLGLHELLLFMALPLLRPGFLLRCHEVAWTGMVDSLEKERWFLGSDTFGKQAQVLGKHSKT